MSGLTDRTYAALKPQERLRAALSAAARHDDLELDRLIDTCQQKTYRMVDDEFMRPLRRFPLMAERHHAKLTTMALAAVFAMHLADMVANRSLNSEDLGGNEEPETNPALSSDGEVKAADAAVHRLLAALRGAMEAWEAFCGEVGLSAQESPAFQPIQESDGVLGAVLSVFDGMDAEPDDAYALKYLGVLRTEWSRHCRQVGD